MGVDETGEQAEDVLCAVRRFVDDDLPHYSDCLKAAYAEAEPVFAKRQYREFFWHCASTVPGWLASVVFANAEVESEGAVKLHRIWRGVDCNTEVDGWVMAHSVDESRHSRVFLKLAAHAFPNLAPPEVVQQLDEELPDVRRWEHVKSESPLDESTLIDYLVQINIGEIRTRVHMRFFAPVIHALASEPVKEKVRHIVNALERDEVRHIGYTARLMEAWAESGDRKLIQDLYRRRLREFHGITLQETEAAARAYGQGRFPELLEL